MSQVRLDKFLANEGAGTRTQVKQLVKAGRIRVNDAPAKDPGMKIDDDTDRIYVDGQLLGKTGIRYFMLHKPAGYISATTDSHQKTVLDLLGSEGKGTSPIGRLDIDTEGMLLLSDDGALIHDLLSPKKHVDKTYLAYVDGTVPQSLAEGFESGLDIGDDKLTLPAKLVVYTAEQVQGLIRDGLLLNDRVAAAQNMAAEGTWTSVTIHEGRFHQIKRMFETAGLKVIYLKRISMGPLMLDVSLQPGQYRALSEEEVEMLRKKRS